MEELLREIRCCEVCRDYLELGPKPNFTAGSGSKLLIIGQAPGKKVHASGIPWDDKSGENLRSWLDIDRKAFYDTTLVSIIPMGFCYPGTGNSGDLPPRKECAPLWHDRLIRQMQSLKLTLLVGAYAQRHYLKEQMEVNLTKTVKNFHRYLPGYFVLPHPSPRNNIWLAKNGWFLTELLPELKSRVRSVLGS